MITHLLSENYRAIHNPWHLSYENISHVCFSASVAFSCRILKEDQVVNMLSHGTRGTHAVRRNMPRAQPKLDVRGTDRTGCRVRVWKGNVQKKVTQVKCSLLLITKLQNPCFNAWQIKTFLCIYVAEAIYHSMTLRWLFIAPLLEQLDTAQ